MKNLFLIFSYCKPLKTSHGTLVYCLHALHWAILWSLNHQKPGLRCDILSARLQLLTAAFSNHYTLDFTFPIFTWMSDKQKHPHHYHTSCTSFLRMVERWYTCHAVWSVAKCILYFKQTVPWKLWDACPWRKTVQEFHLHRERTSKEIGRCYNY